MLWTAPAPRQSAHLTESAPCCSWGGLPSPLEMRDFLFDFLYRAQVAVRRRRVLSPVPLTGREWSHVHDRKGDVADKAGPDSRRSEPDSRERASPAHSGGHKGTV